MRSLMRPRPSLVPALLLVACTTASAAESELPPLAQADTGVWRVDLDADGHEDLVVSHGGGYGVYLFVPSERAKPGLGWPAGWTRVMREGKPGDEAALPPLTGADVTFANGIMQAGGVRMTYEELLRVPGPKPRSPEESHVAMRLPPGLTATLVAAEPLVMDPVFIDWDERGRMWVAEMGDYPFAEGEATSDGKVTWKDGVPGEGAGQGLQTGRVRILEDADGDGRYEKSTLFLDGLRHVTGLACWKGGVFVASVPDIFHAKDTDGDGRCDVREPWFTGFKAGNPQHLVNGFCWGLDGWLHGANGDSGGDVVSARTGEKIPLRGNDFRFDPRTGEFRLETGMTQCGKWRDDFGNWFGNNNATPGWHYWLPLSHLEKHPDITPRSLRADLTADRSVFPVGRMERRLNQANSANRVTSGCNPMPYRDTALGSAATGCLFVCEPAHHAVLRQVLDYSGSTITCRRHPEDVDREFLASEDRWFRPVMARTGPDGALYVVDMYRLVLEHPEWVPAEMARRMQLRGGETMGRIWRIAPEGLRATFPTIDIASTNGWSRDTAQRLAFERGRLENESAVRSLARSPSQPVRVQALFTLRGLGLLPTDAVVATLRQEWPHVRGAAVVAAGGDELMPPEAALLHAQQQSAAAGNTGGATVPLIQSFEPDRQKVVARYLAAATMPGDAARGRVALEKGGCIACHRLGALGREVGPDLATVGGKPPAQLIEAIFDPNRAVEQRYTVTTFVLEDGTVASGLIVADAPGSVTIRMAGGGERVIRRSEIEESQQLATSIMPMGLEALISLQDCADLLAALREQ
jgi:putative membrane-bound dehydrogenase-like protein